MDAAGTYEVIINVVLLSLLAATAIAISRIRGLFAVAMLSGLYSLLCSCLFVVLDAVDVAFTEAAVGAGITTVLFVGTFALTDSREKSTSRTRQLTGFAVVALAAGVLLWASQDMPWFGQPDSPVQNHPVTERYLEQSRNEIGVPNAVTAVLASYRGYDTLGEVVVIFTAGIAVLMLLGRGGAGTSARQDGFGSDDD